MLSNFVEVKDHGRARSHRAILQSTFPFLPAEIAVAVGLHFVIMPRVVGDGRSPPISPGDLHIRIPLNAISKPDPISACKRIGIQFSSFRRVLRVIRIGGV